MVAELEKTRAELDRRLRAVEAELQPAPALAPAQSATRISLRRNRPVSPRSSELGPGAGAGGAIDEERAALGATPKTSTSTLPLGDQNGAAAKTLSRSATRLNRLTSVSDKNLLRLKYSTYTVYQVHTYSYVLRIILVTNIL